MSVESLEKSFVITRHTMPRRSAWVLSTKESPGHDDDDGVSCDMCARFSLTGDNEVGLSDIDAVSTSERGVESLTTKTSLQKRRRELLEGSDVESFGES